MRQAVSTACLGADASEAIQASIVAELDADNVSTQVRDLARFDPRVGLLARYDDFLYMITHQNRIADYS